ncbi:MAG: hypothetical protein AAFQ94_28505 [Bacteroidota bacterium]
MNQYFKEEQRFNSWWIRGAFAISLGGLLIPLYRIAFLNDTSIPLAPLVILLVVLTVVATLILGAKLETQVDKYAIKYRYIPFINNWKRIEKGDIRNLQVRKYSPIREFGGYGYRVKLNGDKALNVKGDMGLHIEYKKNNKLLLGTQKPEELRITINRLMNIQSVD